MKVKVTGKLKAVQMDQVMETDIEGKIQNHLDNLSKKIGHQVL
jgi:hypothetical protein